MNPESTSTLLPTKPLRTWPALFLAALIIICRYVPGFIEAMIRAGYRGPYGVEILSRELRRLPVAEAARRSFETARAQFR